MSRSVSANRGPAGSGLPDAACCEPIGRTGLELTEVELGRGVALGELQLGGSAQVLSYLPDADEARLSPPVLPSGGPGRKKTGC